MTKGLGTTKNPPNINLGRHYMSFVGSTPFYNAARNGDPDDDAAAGGARRGSEHADPTWRHAVDGARPASTITKARRPGPLTGVSEAERLEAVKLAVELGNDLNAKYPSGRLSAGRHIRIHARALSGQLRTIWPNLGTGDARWDGFTALHGAVLCNQPSILQYLVDKGADPTHQEQARLDAFDAHPRHLHGELEEGIPGGRGDPEEGDGAKRAASNEWQARE